MKKHYSKAEREQYISDWKTSGLSQLAYSQQQGIHKSTFYNWVAKQQPPSQQKNNAFIPASITISSPSVTIQVSGRLVVSCQIAQLAEVIQVLERC